MQRALHIGRVLPGQRLPQRSVRAAGLKENVAKLPAIDGIRRISVGAVTIDNVDGKRASIAIYNHLAQAHNGKLDKAAAQEGLQLYDEYVEEARSVPGSHPNIDLLLRVVEDGLTLDVVVERE